ncbi:MAG: bifunctional hydroxymethylpyrimidine kinase/phosphomethylpyrimidine kinase [Rhizobiaceae bacterium]|nr:bifunctional hydroxymethylpyrimidine kinase/phosphomethylpyrimidine kinase [Rhizobiaceae bacterium]
MSDKPAENRTAIALTIAGSDSGGGAGIQADLKAMSALGVYGASVITAITAQNTMAVTDVHEIPVVTIANQIDAVLDDLAVGAIKIGMLSSVDIIETVSGKLRDTTIPIVSDPVMVAKSGDRLLRDDALSALRDKLVPLTTVLTPNLPEAADLLGRDEATSADAMLDQAKALLALGPKSVLMKGGHADGEICVDLLVSQDGGVERFEAPRLDTKNTHGTGCTLSASIASGLAKGLDVSAAVEEAHAYLQGAIRAADTLTIGSGHGPVHHFHEVWK